MISVGVRLSAFNLPQIARLTYTDDLHLEELGEKKVALFCCIPDSDRSLNYLVGMIYGQLIQTLYYVADRKYKGRLPVPVHLLIDEAPNIALPTDNFLPWLSTMRSRAIEYFTRLIQSHSDWEFVDIYADEGITGTRADKRDEFQRLMRDCRAGRVDRILVKSISRFGRNSTDSIQAVRELKLLGIAVVFEKEGIDTGQMTSEMYFSMYSAFSQEESTSIAKNMRRGAAMRMKNGTYRLSQAPYGPTKR